MFFYAGYLFGGGILGESGKVPSRMTLAVAALAIWAVANLWLVKVDLAATPFISLALGLTGAAAVVIFSVLLAQYRLLDSIRYCGSNSIVIYLAFFLPMAATRTALVKFGLITDPGTVAAIVTLIAVTVPLILYWLVRGTSLNFLFERPDRFRLIKQRPLNLQPAE